jgi:hypothetical protein
MVPACWGSVLPGSSSGEGGSMGCAAVGQTGRDGMGWDGMGWDGMGWNGMGEKRLLGDSTPLGWGSDKKTTAVSGGKDRGC